MDDECPADPVGKFFWIIETPFRKWAEHDVDAMFKSLDDERTRKIVKKIKAREPPITLPEKAVKIVARVYCCKPLRVVAVHEYESGGLAADGIKRCLEQIESAGGRRCEFEYVKSSEFDPRAYSDFCEVMARYAPGRRHLLFWRRKPAKA